MVAPGKVAADDQRAAHLDAHLEQIDAKLNELLELKAEIQKVIGVFASGGGLKMAAALIRAKP